MYYGNRVGICVKDIFDKFLEESFNNDIKRIKTHYPMNIWKREVEGVVSGYIIEYALAGFSKEEIEVKVCGDVLTLCVESKKEIEDDKVPVRVSISNSSMSYSYQLTEDIDKDNIYVSYIDGILRIELPFKKEITGVKKLDIN